MASVGVIQGTGLGLFSQCLQPIVQIPYREIPGFCESTVESHKGAILYGSLRNKKVIALQGRFHLYEGYNFSQVTFPVQVMHKLGVETLLISNAAGALNRNFRKGELMRINDHINLQNTMPEPGAGNNFRPAYNVMLARLIDDLAIRKGIKLHQGIYAAVTGPMLETKAEYRMLGIMGADAVGMSTIPEVMMACRLGMRCTAISVLTDECDPDNLVPVTLEEIIRVATGADKILSELFEEIIHRC